MRFSDVFATSLVAPLVAAHGGDIPGAPRVFGMPKHMKARNPWTGHQEAAVPVQGPKLQVRQGGNGEGRCGTQGGGASCAVGFCCSSAGYCGNTKEHCAAPDCQIDFGPGCDANKTPAGTSTRGDARPQLGNIAYGGLGIRECLKPNTVAITYDDGPYIYTEQVMEQFRARNAHATFFVTGNNLGKGAIDENWRGVIQDMYNDGHQIASHSWSHQDLSLISQEQRYDQMVKNEMAIRNIIGKYPTYMRPPYSSCNDACQAVLLDLGYVVTSFDLDTDDYNQLTPVKIQTAKDNFKKGIDTAGPGGDRLAIAHDIHELTALNLTGYMLNYLYSNGFTAVTVGECMNDPPANWYRDSTPAVATPNAASSSAPVPTPTGPTSTDGNCGTVNPLGAGQSCVGFVGPDGLSECCSQYGYCGNSVDHCGSSCNPLYGKCGTQPSVSSSASVNVSLTSSAAQPTISVPTSNDGTCGATAQKTCRGFLLNGVQAECCSEYGYCGNSADHCGPTCNTLYGNCGSSGSSSSVSVSASPSISISPSASVSESASASASASISVSVSSTSSAAQPTASLPTSDDATCGAAAGKTYIGFTYEGVAAECCSASNYCGNTADHCGAGCNPLYGNCSALASASASASESASSSVVSASASMSTSSSMAPSAQSSASPSASASNPGSSSAVRSSSASASASMTPSATPSSARSSASASASATPSTSASAIPSVAESISATPSASASASNSGSSSVVRSSSAFSSASPSASRTPSASASPTPSVSESKSATPSASVSEFTSSSASLTPTPVSSSSSTPVVPSSSTPMSLSFSTPVSPSSSKAASNSIFPSTISTMVRPSSTSSSTSSATPSSTALPVSSNGKCGKDNGGQTCAGYKNLMGWKIGCCCKQTGRCSTDPWACGLGCDKKYGNCWF